MKCAINKFELYFEMYISYIYFTTSLGAHRLL